MQGLSARRSRSACAAGWIAGQRHAITVGGSMLLEEGFVQALALERYFSMT
ncbi:hypothetical protein BH24PSE2_BH24PSE2_00330 [soil metagenome]